MLHESSSGMHSNRSQLCICSTTARQCYQTNMPLSSRQHNVDMHAPPVRRRPRRNNHHCGRCSTEEPILMLPQLFSDNVAVPSMVQHNQDGLSFFAEIQTASRRTCCRLGQKSYNQLGEVPHHLDVDAVMKSPSRRWRLFEVIAMTSARPSSSGSRMISPAASHYVKCHDSRRRFTARHRDSLKSRDGVKKEDLSRRLDGARRTCCEHWRRCRLLLLYTYLRI